MNKMLLYFLQTLCLLPFLVLAILIPKRRQKIIFGTEPLFSNKYWCQALSETSYDAITLMRTYYASIHNKNDFDLLFEDLMPAPLHKVKPLLFLLPYLAFLYALRHAKVVHMHFHGFSLEDQWFWRIEAHLFKWAGIKTVLTPYGADAYLYSQILDPSTRNALLLIKTYRQAQKEPQIQKRVDYWVQHADVLLTGSMIDGIGRWDVTVPQIIHINAQEWQAKTTYSQADGKKDAVKIMHTPNHRGFKGTEFLLKAVEELQAEGLLIELILLEKVPNQQVRQLMQEVDILAEQFIFPGGYALSGIEGMASGLPVMANLNNETYTRLYRRYSFLNECPVVSTTPENIKVNLRTLIGNPDLRQMLGKAGRLYVEKYHSAVTTQYLFGTIYQKILEGQDIDLMNLFHPLKSAYNHSRPQVEHPLIDSQLPEELLLT